MPRERKGFTVTRGDKLYLRIQFTDSQGKRRERMRRVENKTDARELRKQLLDKLDNQGEKILDGDKLTFEQLANTYKEKKLQPAEYHSDRKVKGMRNYKSPRIFLEYLKEYFAKKRVRDITH